MIDQSKIDWLLNGEEAEADILNRPLRQMLTEVNTEFSTNAVSVGSKVDKQDGKGLSDTNFTQAEKDKLSSLESSKFVGLFVNESALPATGNDGDYANVDGGVGSDVYRVIWDSSDSKWVRVQGVQTEFTDAQIKQQYESNPDTNAFTDDQKSKLNNVASGATANRSDTLNADKVHTHPWGEVTGQPAQATRWPTFAEVTGKPSTYAPSGHTHPASQVTGLGTAATRNVGTAAGNVMEVGAFGLGGSTAPVTDLNLVVESGVYRQENPSNGISYSSTLNLNSADGRQQLTIGRTGADIAFRGATSGSGSAGWSTWKTIYHTGNMPTTATRWPTFAEVTGKPSTYAPSRSTNTVEGGIKTRISGTTLWMTNNGNNA